MSFFGGNQQQEYALPPLDNTMPPMSMPMMPPMFQPQDSNIASMRWEGQNIINELYKILGGYDVKTDKDGNIVYERKNKFHRAFINDEGLEALSAIIQSNVNPYVSLTNIELENANELIRQILYDITECIITKQEEYGIKDISDANIIYNVIKSLVYCQVMRAVNGHESRNFRTQTTEQTMTQNNQLQQKGGLCLPRDI